MSYLNPKEFWNKKYKNQSTGWDIGYVSTPIKTYFDQLTDKTIKILIPGAGSAYEAIYAFNQGFKNVYICDISPIAISLFKEKYPEFPPNQIIEGDFFELNDTFDLVIEQTFFCAINPKSRKAYIKKMIDILSDHGKLVGLLFNREFDREGPPFGGSSSDYLKSFTPFMNINTMSLCYNSIPSRQDNELFIILSPKTI